MKPKAIINFFVAVAFSVSSLADTSSAIAATDKKNNGNVLRFEKQYISANLRNFSLKTLLHKLNQHDDINIIIPKNMLDSYVTVSFKSLPILEALTEILKDANYVIEKRAPRSNAYNVQPNIYLLPDEKLALSSPPSPASKETQALQVETDDAEQKPPISLIDQNNLTGNSPEARINSLNAMVSEHGDEAVPFIISALSDTSASVRLNALRLADARTSGEIPIDTLEQLALSDENAEVRAYALQLIAQNPEYNENVDEILFLQNSTE